MLTDSNLNRTNYDGMHVTEKDYAALKALFGEYMVLPSKVDLKAAHVEETFYNAIGRYGDDPKLALKVAKKQQKNLNGIRSRLIDESPEALDNIFSST